MEKRKDEMQLRPTSARIDERRDAEIRRYLQMDYVDNLYVDESIKPIDVDYHWVRMSVLGEPDENRMVEMYRRGWSPVPSDRHPELCRQDPNSRQDESRKGLIYNKGLVLHERPKVYGEIERKKMHEHNVKTMTGIPGLQNHEDDPLMPMHVFHNETGYGRSVTFQD